MAQFNSNTELLVVTVVVAFVVVVGCCVLSVYKRARVVWYDYGKHTIRLCICVNHSCISLCGYAYTKLIIPNWTIKNASYLIGFWWNSLRLWSVCSRATEHVARVNEMENIQGKIEIFYFSFTYVRACGVCVCVWLCSRRRYFVYKKKQLVHDKTGFCVDRHFNV